MIFGLFRSFFMCDYFYNRTRFRPKRFMSCDYGNNDKIAYRSFIFIMAEWNNFFVFFLWFTNTSKNTNCVNTITETIFDIPIHFLACNRSECAWYFLKFFMRSLHLEIEAKYSASNKTSPNADPSLMTLFFLLPFKWISLSKFPTFISMKSSSFLKRVDSYPIWRIFRRNAWNRDARVRPKIAHNGPIRSKLI